MSNPYMYLFIREDLSIPQQIIQTAHAVDELNKKIRQHGTNTNFMVLFSSKSEKELFTISEWLKDNDIVHEMFFEPDIQAYTAIATQPIRGESRELFKNFRLKR